MLTLRLASGEFAESSEETLSLRLAIGRVFRLGSGSTAKPRGIVRYFGTGSNPGGGPETVWDVDSAAEKAWRNAGCGGAAGAAARTGAAGTEGVIVAADWAAEANANAALIASESAVDAGAIPGNVAAAVGGTSGVASDVGGATGAAKRVGATAEVTTVAGTRAASGGTVLVPERLVVLGGL